MRQLQAPSCIPTAVTNIGIGLVALGMRLCDIMLMPASLSRVSHTCRHTEEVKTSLGVTASCYHVQCAMCRRQWPVAKIRTGLAA